MENSKGIPETATPHRVSLRETVLSRKGRGNDHDNDKNDISFWIATGRQRAPRN
jgi:hypothetical protein